MILPAPKTETAEMRYFTGKGYEVRLIERQYYYKIEERLFLTVDDKEGMSGINDRLKEQGHNIELAGNIQGVTITRTATEPYQEIPPSHPLPDGRPGLPLYKGNPWGSFEMDPEALNEDYWEERRERASLGFALVERGDLKGIGGFDLMEGAYNDVMLAFLWHDPSLKDFSSLEKFSKPGFIAHRDFDNNLITFDIHVFTSKSEMETLVKEWEGQREWGKRFQEKLNKVGELFPAEHQELLKKYAGGHAFGDMLAFEKEVDNLLGFGDMAEIQKAPFELEEGPKIAHPLVLSDPLNIPSDILSYNLGRAYGTQGFGPFDGGRWPGADLSKGATRAIAEIKPPDEIEPFLSGEELAMWQGRMWQHVKGMGDRTADTFYIFAHLWMNQAKNPEQMIRFTAEDILRCRGLKPKKSGTGRRGGYEDKQKREVAQDIGILDSTWLTVIEKDITEEVQGKKGPLKRRKKWGGQGRAVEITFREGQLDLSGRMDVPSVWYGKMGTIFARDMMGPGKQYALIAQKALHFDPHNKKYEKRLTRYLAIQWRIRQREGNYLSPYKVETLLSEIDLKISSSNPSVTKERFESMMDTLQREEVIKQWQYEQAHEEIVGRRGWVKEWMGWKVIIEPPQEIMDRYCKIKTLPRAPKALPESMKAKPLSIGEQVKKARLTRNLTLMQAAEEIEIDAGVLSRVERGGRTPRSANLQKLQFWLKQSAKDRPE
jgi:hypothetical protein